jgi:hypothetical protein
VEGQDGEEEGEKGEWEEVEEEEEGRDELEPPQAGRPRGRGDGNVMVEPDEEDEEGEDSDYAPAGGSDPEEKSDGGSVDESEEDEGEEEPQPTPKPSRKAPIGSKEAKERPRSKASTKVLHWLVAVLHSPLPRRHVTNWSKCTCGQSAPSNSRLPSPLCDQLALSCFAGPLKCPPGSGQEASPGVLWPS